MTNEQFSILSAYEPLLRTACRYSYSRAISTKQWNEIARVYSELTNSPREKMAACSSCRTAFLKKVAKLYFEYKKEQYK